MARQFNPTPGEWEFIEGESGFSGSREEPPVPPYPPTIYVTTETPEGVVFDFELAELRDPVYPVETRQNEYDEGLRWLGDAESNGRLMAAAPDLLRELKDAVRSFWGDWPEFERESFRREFPEHWIVRSERAIAKAEGRSDG